MRNKITVNGLEAKSKCIGEINKAYNEHPFLTVTIDTRKPRSLNQNSLLHAWCSQVATEEREYTDKEVKCNVKHYFFMPILRGEDEDYDEQCRAIIDPLSYEKQVAAMRYWPCTSLMKTKQLARGLEAMQAHFAGRVDLTFPDDK